MIETIMYAAIGFLTATLLALLVLPAVWRRAVRLTRRRIEGAIPVTFAEIQADKDQERAAFAVETRRLELEIERARARTAAQWAELTRQAEELRTRQAALDDVTARFQDLEARHDTLSAHDREVTDRLAAREAEIEEMGARLAATLADLAATRQALGETTTREEELKVEHVALTTLRDTLRGRITELERLIAATNAQMETERATLRVTSESLSSEVVAHREAKSRLAAVEAELGMVSAEASALRAEAAALKLRADSLEQRTHAAELKRDAVEAEAARVTAESLAARAAAEAAARQAGDVAEMLRAEKAMLEGALAKAREDRAELQQRLDTLIPTAVAAPGEAEDVARLRARILDIAAEVAHLTASLEGPGSPIHALIGAHPPGKNGGGNGGGNGGAPSLADRIRALRDEAEAPVSAEVAAPERVAPGRAVAG